MSSVDPPCRPPSAPSAFTGLLHLQSGLFTRSQARDCGISRDVIRRRVRTGRWQRVVGDVFAAFGGPVTVELHRRAALLYTAGAVLAGPTALAVHGFRYAPDLPEVHVVVPRCHARDNEGFVRVHTASTAVPAVVIGGMPAAAVAWAVVQTMAWLPEPSLARAVMAEALQRRRTTVAAIEDAASGARRSARLIRATLDEVRAGARSAPEAELLAMVLRAGLPAPRCNEDLAVGSEWLGRPDMYWDVGLIVEIDSVEWHSSPERQADTMRRHRRFTRAGFVVLHYTPNELRRDPAGVVAEIAETYRRLAAAR